MTGGLRFFDICREWLNRGFAERSCIISVLGGGALENIDALLLTLVVSLQPFFQLDGLLVLLSDVFEEGVAELDQ